MRGRAPIIVASVAVIVPALFAIFFLVLPKMGEVTTTEEQLQAAQDEEIALTAELRALQEAEAAAPETQASIDEIEAQIPPTADLPGLFRELQGAADQAAVDFFSLSPGSPAVDPTNSYSTITSSITVTGSYFAIDEYLFLLETLPRAAKVTSITLSPGAAATDTGTTATDTGTTSASPSALSLAITVDFYTTDTSAGPGSIPGPSTSGA